MAVLQALMSYIVFSHVCLKNQSSAGAHYSYHFFFPPYCLLKSTKTVFIAKRCCFPQYNNRLWITNHPNSLESKLHKDIVQFFCVQKGLHPRLKKSGLHSTGSKHLQNNKRLRKWFVAAGWSPTDWHGGSWGSPCQRFALKQDIYITFT